MILLLSHNLIKIELHGIFPIKINLFSIIVRWLILHLLEQFLFKISSQGLEIIITNLIHIIRSLRLRLIPVTSIFLKLIKNELKTLIQDLCFSLITMITLAGNLIFLFPSISRKHCIYSFWKYQFIIFSNNKYTGDRAFFNVLNWF